MFSLASGKSGSDDLFDKLDTSKLNAHLKDLMPGLTAKVFRTFNASITLDDMVKYIWSISFFNLPIICLPGTDCGGVQTLWWSSRVNRLVLFKITLAGCLIFRHRSTQFGFTIPFFLIQT